jgi:hypothetical protein
MKTQSDSSLSAQNTGFIRAIACITLFAVISVFAAPAAQAAGADGSYRLTRVSGTFVANGQTVDVPTNILSNAMLRDGRIIVKDNKLPIYRAKWGNLFDEFTYAGFTGSLRVTGPSNLVFNRVDGAFVGQTTQPVKLVMSGEYMGTPISMSMSMTFKAKVVGDTMTITVPVKLNAMGVIAMTGTIKMTAKR